MSGQSTEQADGVIPQSIRRVFDAIHSTDGVVNVRMFEFHAKFIEIYNEKVIFTSSAIDTHES
jgi:hypothetical protein